MNQGEQIFLFVQSFRARATQLCDRRVKLLEKIEKKNTPLAWWRGTRVVSSNLYSGIQAWLAYPNRVGLMEKPAHCARGCSWEVMVAYAWWKEEGCRLKSFESHLSRDMKRAPSAFPLQAEQKENPKKKRTPTEKSVGFEADMALLSMLLEAYEDVSWGPLAVTLARRGAALVWRMLKTIGTMFQESRLPKSPHHAPCFPAVAGADRSHTEDVAFEGGGKYINKANGKDANEETPKEKWRRHHARALTWLQHSRESQSCHTSFKDTSYAWLHVYVVPCLVMYLDIFTYCGFTQSTLLHFKDQEVPSAPSFVTTKRSQHATLACKFTSS